MENHSTVFATAHIGLYLVKEGEIICSSPLNPSCKMKSGVRLTSPRQMRWTNGSPLTRRQAKGIERKPLNVPIQH